MLKMAPMWKGIVNKMEKHGLNMYFIVLCMFYLFPPDVEGFMMRSLLLPVVPAQGGGGSFKNRKL